MILVARIIRGSLPDPLAHLPRNLRDGQQTAAPTLTHLIEGLPIIIWVMISFFEDVPPIWRDAGLIDGCPHFGVFWRIALPLVKPGVVATGTSRSGSPGTTPSSR